MLNICQVLIHISNGNDDILKSLWLCNITELLIYIIYCYDKTTTYDNYKDLNIT